MLDKAESRDKGGLIYAKEETRNAAQEETESVGGTSESA
jgi:hypothetical protein